MRMRTKTELRSLARRLRITGLIQRVQGLRGGDYEESFHRALRGSVRAGDTVWDVGANVGYYTTQFSDWAGEHGKVVAFEPIPASFAALREQADGRPNVQLLNLALGDRDETMTIALEDDPTSPLNSFATPVSAEAAKLELPVRRGDGVRADEGLPAPDVLKVDVEGFEQEVLEGLAETLREGSCRAVLCEVHFAVLESRGRKHAPDEIVRLLEGHGFTVRWADASHLVARRGEPAAR
jgi:FkbM family methyltransferase